MRLIDIEPLQKEHWHLYRYVAGVYAARLEEMKLEEVPTIDAAPVKHGRWIMDEEPHDGDVRCSVCLIAIDQMHERNHGLLNALTGGKWHTFYHYCPNCGAKMDLEEQDAKKET